MMGVLDHEIGTHFLRKHNEKLQQWYKKREKFDMRTCIATEEGLACTNQMVQTVKDGNCKPFLYRSALNYYAAIKAREMSFVDLFKDLEKYVDSPQARWKFVLRVKRGLTDTSQKGGLYKDQVYLEGAVQVLSQRKNLNFKALLCGKISLYDLKRDAIYNILNYEGQLLPPFMQDMEEYMNCLDVIAECNHIETEEAFENQGEQDGDMEQQPENVIDETEQNDDQQNNKDEDDNKSEEQEIIHDDDDAPLSNREDPQQDSPIKESEVPHNIDFIIQSSMQIEDRVKNDDQHEQIDHVNYSARDNQQNDLGQGIN